MMFLPLALILSATILSTTGSDVEIKQVFPDVGEYVYNIVPMNWTDAYQYCKKVAGHIAVIDSEAEKQALTTMMVQNGVTSIHLGFHDRHSEGDYYTITDQPIGSNQWAVGYPRGGVDYSCGGFSVDGFMDTNCAADHVTICEYAATKAQAEGYELISGHSFYKYHEEKLTWVEAWKTCKSEGAYLHILNSQDEQDKLQEKFRNAQVWVGVHRINANNNKDFQTIFDVPLASTGFTRWYVGSEPAGTYLTHPYVYSYSNQRLLTQTNVVEYTFICEIDNV